MYDVFTCYAAFLWLSVLNHVLSSALSGSGSKLSSDFWTPQASFPLQGCHQFSFKSFESLFVLMCKLCSWIKCQMTRCSLSDWRANLFLILLQKEPCFWNFLLKWKWNDYNPDYILLSHDQLFDWQVVLPLARANNSIFQTCNYFNHFFFLSGLHLCVIVWTQESLFSGSVRWGFALHTVPPHCVLLIKNIHNSWAPRFAGWLREY